ncbi:hypothetical protein H8K33_09480 [Undibacterium amnicola]|uniref:4Fe-4S ferredoxin-type domain-containing protein n=1 Tax=Undibacterium amnicola TaxID=1834038 RepID=A0ABR6XQW7_9BURK|nr:hypothetical protein [Undibacterium amnicola]
MKPSGVQHEVIWLQSEAPLKPKAGQCCNGCGVCCAASPCPVSRLFLWQWRGSCRALEWHAQARQYRCGMLLRPAHYLSVLPVFLEPILRYWVRRSIAADVACDSTVEVDADISA